MKNLPMKPQAWCDFCVTGGDLAASLMTEELHPY
jgi:hypothetical protein